MKHIETSGLAVAVLVMLATSATATVHTVNQVDRTFDPDDLTVSVGDTVQWIWSSLPHTVTNGIDLNDPDLGTLFDEPLDMDHPVVTHVFTSPGDVPYLCRFHVLTGMTGVVHVTGSVGVNDTPQVASLLAQNAPNPFNPRTEIAFTVPATSDGAAVSLRIFDLQGRLVRALIDQIYPSGPATATWDGQADDGRAMPSGTYMYRVRIGRHVEARPMTLVR